MSGGLAVTVSGLSTSYGSLTAVDSISFSVGRGEIFGILGPNGAGKTTALEMVEGLRRPDAGQILVECVLTWPDPRPVKTLIGVQLQATALTMPPRGSNPSSGSFPSPTWRMGCVTS